MGILRKVKPGSDMALQTASEINDSGRLQLFNEERISHHAQSDRNTGALLATWRNS